MTHILPHFLPRALGETEAEAIKVIHEAASALELAIRDSASSGAFSRYHSLALTAVEQTVMWAVKAVTHGAPPA